MLLTNLHPISPRGAAAADSPRGGAVGISVAPRSPRVHVRIQTQPGAAGAAAGDAGTKDYNNMLQVTKDLENGLQVDRKDYKRAVTVVHEVMGVQLGDVFMNVVNAADTQHSPRSGAQVGATDWTKRA